MSSAAAVEVAPCAAESSPPSPPQEEQQVGQDEQQQQQDEQHEPAVVPKPYVVEVHHEPEEVAERLFAAPVLPDLKKEVSGLWGWVSKGSASLVSKATEIAEQAVQQAEELRQGVVESAGEQRAMFEHEKDRFMAQPDTLAEDDGLVFGRRTTNSDSNSALGASAATTTGGAASASASTTLLLPWLPESEYSEAIKTQVLRLSEEDSTFLVPPPDEVDFTFDFDASAGLALALLEVDTNLSKKRFALVPKEVKETEFWHHYFYRVHLIREAYGHSSFAPASPSDGTDVGGARDSSPGLGSPHSSGGLEGRGNGLVDEGDDELGAKGNEVKGHELSRSPHDDRGAGEEGFGSGNTGNEKIHHDEVDGGQDGALGSSHWEDELRAELDFDEENFDMVDLGEDDDDDDDNDGGASDIIGVSDDDDDALALEERIRAELELETDDAF